MSVWTTGTSGLETVLATLGTSIHTKGSNTNSVVSTQPGHNLLGGSTHLGHHTYINPTAPQFVYKPSSGVGYQQKVTFLTFTLSKIDCMHVIFGVKMRIFLWNCYVKHLVWHLKLAANLMFSIRFFLRTLEWDKHSWLYTAIWAAYVSIKFLSNSIIFFRCSSQCWMVTVLIVDIIKSIPKHIYLALFICDSQPTNCELYFYVAWLPHCIRY